MLATRMLVVDDHPVVVEGLSLLLRREEDLRVEWIAFNVSDATRICQTNIPDLAVVDLSLGDGSGIDLIRAMHAMHPAMPILVMSMHNEELYADLALQAGARGYITKHLAPKHVVEAIRRVRDAGDPCVGEPAPGQVNATPVNGNEAPDHAHAGLQQLSERERDVFGLIGEGLRKREIADRLGLSVNTVETHRAGIKKKLRFRSAAELARFAYLSSRR